MKAHEIEVDPKEPLNADNLQVALDEMTNLLGQLQEMTENGNQKVAQALANMDEVLKEARVLAAANDNAMNYVMIQLSQLAAHVDFDLPVFSRDAATANEEETEVQELI